MVAAEAVGHVQGVAPASVGLSLAHETGPEGVAASVDVMQQAAAAQVQLAGALPVGGKFGAQEMITSRGPLKKNKTRKKQNKNSNTVSIYQLISS